MTLNDLCDGRRSSEMVATASLYMISKLPLTKAGALRDGDILFVRLFVPVASKIC